MKKLKIIFVFSIAFFCFSCSTKTKMDSDDYNSQESRVDALDKVMKFKSPILDCEFELFNVNGFPDSRSSLLPGASSRDYKIAVKIDSSQIKKWTIGLKQDSALVFDTSWISEIVKNRKQNWVVHSKPKYFTEGTTFIRIVYEDEGVVFERELNP